MADAITSLFWKYKGLCDSATKESDEPTPGYLYNELLKITYDSQEECQKLLDYLLKRIKKNNFNVKLKVLLVLKHVIQKGHNQFRRDLQRRSEEIRDCLNYRGVADHLRGDTPYRLVREASQLVMNLLFSIPDEEENSTTNVPEKFLENIERNVKNTTPVAPETTRGFSSFKSPSMETVPSKNKLGTPFLNEKHYNSQTSNFGKISAVIEPQFSSEGHRREAGKPMGGWNTKKDKDIGFTSNKNYQLPKQTDESEVFHRESRDGSLEEHYIDELTAPGGVRVSGTILSQFIRCIDRMDQILVASLLLSKLHSNSSFWQIKLKALQAIEAIIKSNAAPICVGKFSENIGAFGAQTSSVQKSVRDKASLIINLLNPKSKFEDHAPLASFDEALTESLESSELNSMFSGLDQVTPEQTDQARVETQDLSFDGLSLYDNGIGDQKIISNNSKKLNSFEDLLDFGETSEKPTELTSSHVTISPQIQELGQLEFDPFKLSLIDNQRKSIKIQQMMDQNIWPPQQSKDQNIWPPQQPKYMSAQPFKVPIWPPTTNTQNSSNAPRNTYLSDRNLPKNQNSDFSFVNEEKDYFDFVQEEIKSQKKKSSMS